MESKKDILVSIIIPTYNLEDYVDQCINSIKRQSLSNIELIIVDDCSTDNTETIIKRHIQDNEELCNITFIKNDSNMGAGYSRNKGMEQAQGKYLVFLDGDDFFESDMIEKLYSKCEKTSADVAICDFYFFYNTTKRISKYENNMDCFIKNINDVFKLSDINWFAFQYINEIAWNKMFKRDFIEKNNIRFQCQHNANDQFFVFYALLKAERIVKVREPLLYYRVSTKNQLSASIFKAPKCIWNAVRATVDCIDEMGCRDKYKKSLNTYIINRLIFSLKRVDGNIREELMEFYKAEGFKTLGLEDCNINDFSIPYYGALARELINTCRIPELNESYIYKLSQDSYKYKSLFIELRKIKNLVLWGMGYNGTSFLERASDFGIQFRCLIDINKEKIGKIIQEYEIRDENSLEDGDTVIVLNPEHIVMIQHQIMIQRKETQILDVRAYLRFNLNFREIYVSK